MIAVTGAIDSIEIVHDTVRRMEEGAARLYDQLAATAELMAAHDAALTLHSLAAAARRRARSYRGGVATAEPPPALKGMPPADGVEFSPWLVLECALDMEYAMLGQLEVLAALAEDETVRDEATKLAERKRLHLSELDLRQGRCPAPAGDQD